MHVRFNHNFGKCRPILKIRSQTDSREKWSKIGYHRENTRIRKSPISLKRFKYFESLTFSDLVCRDDDAVGSIRLSARLYSSLFHQNGSTKVKEKNLTK